MSVPTCVRLRSYWFQVHKWIGLSLAVLISPIALTGSALVWHDWLDEALNPERATAAAPALTPAQYQATAERSLAPGERIVSLRFPKEALAKALSVQRNS
jgi:uncharacterized iron-regulated membrane protein